MSSLQSSPVRLTSASGNVAERFADGAPLPGTRLEVDQVLPGVTFADAASGEPARPREFRGRRALVLAFVHDDCEACAGWAERLAARLGGRADAALRIVAPRHGPGQTPGRGGLPLWTDPDGKRARLLDDPDVPAVIVLDRYGAVHAAEAVTDHALPPGDEVAATLDYLEVACPECSV